MGVEDVMTDVREEFYHYPEAKVYLSKPPVIPGLGTAGGFELQLEARGGASFEQLVTAVDTFMMYAGKEKALTGLSSSLQAEIPQLYFDVDRDKAKFLGIPMADIFSTMKAYTGSVYVNDFNMFNRIYRVYIQAEAPYRMHADDINLFSCVRLRAKWCRLRLWERPNTPPVREACGVSICSLRLSSAGTQPPDIVRAKRCASSKMWLKNICPKKLG